MKMHHKGTKDTKGHEGGIPSWFFVLFVFLW